MVKQIWAALESSLFDGTGKEKRGKPGADDTGNKNDGEQAMSGPIPIILALGTTQTLAWASSYYVPAILADPIARDLGVSANWVFAAFSASLVLSAMLGPRIGRQIDLVGGRSVLLLSNLVLAAVLAMLGLTYSIP